MLAILFGLAGVGKNYTGEILARACDGFFWDADEVLTPLMKQYIQEKRHFSSDMIDDFCQCIISRVRVLQETRPRLVIAQAFYREAHRRQLWAAFPQAQFIHVAADDAIVLRRIAQRGHTVDVNYALGMRHAFESPQLPHTVIWNNQEGPLAVEAQIRPLKAQLGLNGATGDTVAATT